MQKKKLLLKNLKNNLKAKIKILKDKKTVSRAGIQESLRIIKKAIEKTKKARTLRDTVINRLKSTREESLRLTRLQKQNFDQERKNDIDQLKKNIPELKKRKEELEKRFGDLKENLKVTLKQHLKVPTCAVKILIERLHQIDNIGSLIITFQKTLRAYQQNANELLKKLNRQFIEQRGYGYIYDLLKKLGKTMAVERIIKKK